MVVKLENKNIKLIQRYDPESDVIISFHFWKNFKGHKLFLKEVIVNTDRWIENFKEFREEISKKYKVDIKKIRVIKQTKEFFRERIKEIKENPKP